MSSPRDLEESISDFFSKAGACTSRIQCDEFANKTFGGSITSVPVQGFREPESPLNMTILASVQAVHPDFVANHSFHGTIGESPALYVYSMNMLPGDNYFDLSLSLEDDDVEHRLETVRSLARFFAQSWQNGSRPEPKSISVTFEDCCSSFDYLSRTLPSRFQNLITQVKDSLPALFSEDYPLVLTHSDFSERNILANPTTGEITGIIDWAEFWSVFCELVDGVSQSEMELVHLARQAGLFLRYGIPYKPGRKGVVGVATGVECEDVTVGVVEMQFTDAVGGVQIP
ncbi:uncharacterized protein C8A04DRAFT_38353 [Dichotomopilus funicola]|uniref:Aminoglycoside phosphotransferase domain-containing protein n=1 Tax=Dichotomopilus funicola TaxID=1934379 RepID=A0AAN6V0Y6_9PEZI|nr:hypothetical protein C8A04DRAFT_38353 [Dichotomopilus funicola]